MPTPCLANSARNFSQFQNATEMGWSSQTQGYLSEGALVPPTALFQLLAGRDPMDARPWLKSYLQSDLKRAVARYKANGNKYVAE